MSRDGLTATPPASQTFDHKEIKAVVAGLMLTILLGALDQTIVSVALPKMAADLGSAGLLAWVVSGYLIAMAVTTPLYGKLGDIYGRRVMLMWALSIFLLASIACALAPSMHFLVLARIAQGLGGGGIISLSQAIIADVVSPRERGRFQGYISAAFAIASVSGPLLGGLLTSYLSWRWVFWINLPLGAAAIFVSHRTLRRLHTPRVKRPVDYPGAVFMILSLTPLLVAVTRAGQGSGWLDALNLQMFGATLIAMALFLWQEKRASEPVVPLALFKNSTVSLSCTVMFIAFIVLVSLSVMIPLRAQMLLGVKADEAGLQLVPFSLGIPIGAYFSGKLASHTGRFKYIQLAGTLGVPLALLGLTLIDAQHIAATLACLAFAGISIGLQLPTSTVGVQNAVAQHHMGIATAVVAFCRSLGAAIGVAVLMAILMATLHDPTGRLSGAEIIKQLVASAGHGPMGDLPAITLAASAQGAFDGVFVLMAGVACISIVLTLMLRNEILGEQAPRPD
jgi:EmrB/QacA subfamily drug resistance transporter